MSGFKFSRNWCAPEVLKIYSNGSSQSAGIKSDVFSEGLIFSCYLLKGEHPYGDLKDFLGTGNNLKDNKPQKLNSNVPI
jgi:serine/threonine protein kinase